MFQKIEISNYFSDDGTKKAVVFKQDRAYGIDFYINEQYNYTMVYNNKSVEYVENAAEDFVLERSGNEGQSV